MTKPILSILFLLFAFSVKGQSHDSTEFQIEVWDTIKKEYCKNYPVHFSVDTNASIIGNFYVNDLTQLFFKGGFLNPKPESKTDLYFLKFLPNGNIECTDLSTKYECANGVVKLSNTGWSISTDGIIHIKFDMYQNGSENSHSGYYILSKVGNKIFLKSDSIIKIKTHHNTK